jgi:hypothetical protein
MHDVPKTIMDAVRCPSIHPPVVAKCSLYETSLSADILARCRSKFLEDISCELRLKLRSMASVRADSI